MKKQVQKLDELLIKKSNPRLYRQMYGEYEKKVHHCPKCGNLFVE